MENDKDTIKSDENKDVISDDYLNIRQSLSGTIAESLVVLLPLIVISIVYLNSSKSILDLAAHPEWSFGSAVFVGLTINRLVGGVARSKSSKKWQNIILAVTCLVVLLLVPSLIILAMILQATVVPTSLIISQVCCFIFSIVAFLIFGTVGDSLILHPSD